MLSNGRVRGWPGTRLLRFTLHSTRVCGVSEPFEDTSFIRWRKPPSIPNLLCFYKQELVLSFVSGFFLIN